MWEEMGLVRVYTKPQGQQPDFADPVVLSAVCCMPFFQFRYLVMHGSYGFTSLFISILLACDFRIEVAALLKTSVITYTGAW